MRYLLNRILRLTLGERIQITGEVSIRELNTVTKAFIIACFGLPALTLFGVTLLLVVLARSLYSYFLVHVLNLIWECYILCWELLGWSVFRRMKIVVLRGFSESDEESQKNNQEFKTYRPTESILSKTLVVLTYGLVVLVVLTLACVLRYVLKFFGRLLRLGWVWVAAPALRGVRSFIRDLVAIARNLGRWGVLLHLNRLFGFAVQEHELTNCFLRLILVLDEKFRLTEENLVAQLFALVVLAPLYVLYRIPSAVVINFGYFLYYLGLILLFFPYTPTGFWINRLVRLTKSRTQKISESIDCLYILEIEYDRKSPWLERKTTSRSLLITLTLKLSVIIFSPLYFLHRLLIVKIFSVFYECLINMFHQENEIKYLD